MPVKIIVLVYIREALILLEQVLLEIGCTY